jgi:hypothetical protein
MTDGKQLRYADMLRFSGGGEGALAPDSSFGPNSLMPGVVSPANRLDLPNRPLEISHLGYSLADDNRTTTAPLESFSRVQLNGAEVLLSIDFGAASSGNTGFSVNQHVVGTPDSTLVPALLNLQRRRARIKHNRRINRRAQIKQGLTLRELLRYGSTGCSMPGSIN